MSMHVHIDKIYFIYWCCKKLLAADLDNQEIHTLSNMLNISGDYLRIIILIWPYDYNILLIEYLCT